MRLLLDSHVLLWSIYDPAKLSSTAANLIRNPQNVLLLSDASLWELSLKIAKGKLAYEFSQHTFRDRIVQLGVQPLSITDHHIQRSVALPPHHADPFDRMLIAQSQIENVPLLTSDRDIARYPIRCLW